MVIEPMHHAYTDSMLWFDGIFRLQQLMLMLKMTERKPQLPPFKLLAPRTCHDWPWEFQKAIYDLFVHIFERPQALTCSGQQYYE